MEILGVGGPYGYLARRNDAMAATLEDIGISAGNRNLAGQGSDIGKHGA